MQLFYRLLFEPSKHREKRFLVTLYWVPIGTIDLSESCSSGVAWTCPVRNDLVLCYIEMEALNALELEKIRDKTVPGIFHR
ncbi:hypothetical protein CEXT_307191 [Caerostris extrusa]|uniref:Uncharacterized protein n=1 Tax=Caerostris extrusa TaxID=172846 RepID=A0AAV4TN76_CAEEX|nr:hypothetical protein CEXT_307191 [Caerostris extrusa]